MSKYQFSRNHFSQQWYANPIKLAEWIQRETPSFAGKVPVAYTQDLLTLCQKHFVQDEIVAGAFLLLYSKRIEFEWDAWTRRTTVGQIYIARLVSNAPQPKGYREQTPSVKPISNGEAARIKRYGIEEYEHRYTLAMKTNDFAGAEVILVAVFKLLWAWAEGHAEARQMARNEPMVEWEEFNRAIDEALARATTLRTHVRYMSREEFKAMRDAPTPTARYNVTIRISSRITTRTAGSARRARR